MASLASVAHAASEFKATHPRLDVLVNNAGIIAGKRRTSPDGHELTWATNFLGLAALTLALVPELESADAPRVVNVSSAAHTSGRIPWDDLELERGYRGWARLRTVETRRELVDARVREAISEYRCERDAPRCDRDEHLERPTGLGAGRDRARATAGVERRHPRGSARDVGRCGGRQRALFQQTSRRSARARGTKRRRRGATLGVRRNDARLTPHLTGRRRCASRRSVAHRIRRTSGDLVSPERT